MVGYGSLASSKAAWFNAKARHLRVLAVVLHDCALVRVIAVPAIKRLIRFDVLSAVALYFPEFRTPFKIECADGFVVAVKPVLWAPVFGVVAACFCEIADERYFAVRDKSHTPLHVAS